MRKIGVRHVIHLCYFLGSNIHRNQPQSKHMPTSVSGYSLCATQGDSIDEENDHLNETGTTNNNNYVQDQLTAFTNSARHAQQLRQSVIYSQKSEAAQLANQTQMTAATNGSGNNSRAGMAMSASNYSMSSGINYLKMYLILSNG